jgi:WD40 repeat protein
MWRIADESSVAKLLRCPGAVGAIAFSPDGRQVLTGCGDSEKQLGESQLWDSELGIPLGKPMPQSSGKKGQVMTVAFSPDGTLAFTGGNNNELRVWNTADASAARPPWLHENIVAAIAFSPNGKFVASSGKNGVVQVRDVASGEIVSTWDAEDREGFWVWSLAFTDDRTLLTGGGPVMQLWRWREKQRIGQGMEHDTEVRTTLLSPDKQMVLTCGHDMKARIWSAVDGRPLSEWMVHKGPVLGGAFRADGRVVATSSADGTLRVWSVPDGKTLMPPVLHDGRVQCVAFSPDGSTLATGCDDGVARLWNADDGASLGAVLRHRGPISRIAFSADGKRIVTGSEDGTARIWMPPAAIQGTPEAVTLWAEVLTGLELDEEGMSQVLPRDEWQRRRRRLEDAGGRLSLKP